MHSLVGCLFSFFPQQNQCANLELHLDDIDGESVIRSEISRFSDLSIHWHNMFVTHRSITEARNECISAVVDGQLVLRQARLRVDAASLDSGASLVGLVELWAQGK
ncbi:hypothetical protein L208DRAFT_1400496 [Tricholoma matsutake]|nr:hypothetical protein L208DRAFT_1400496 [Tricholoma matsutake 945]